MTRIQTLCAAGSHLWEGAPVSVWTVLGGFPAVQILDVRPKLKTNERRNILQYPVIFVHEDPDEDSGVSECLRFRSVGVKGSRSAND